MSIHLIWYVFYEKKTSFGRVMDVLKAFKERLAG